MTKKSVSRVVALEEAFLHLRVWDLFPEPLQQKYKVVKARLTDLGPERIRLMDAAGIDVQVLSHVQPGIQILPDADAELAIEISREVNNWLAEVVRAHPARFAGFATLPTQSPPAAAAELSGQFVSWASKAPWSTATPTGATSTTRRSMSFSGKPNRWRSHLHLIPLIRRKWWRMPTTSPSARPWYQLGVGRWKQELTC